jgi:hypothetical protein
MTVPYTFGTATTSIPLSNLDANFNTPITLGNTAIYLGNTTTTIGNLTLTNVTISSGTANITSNITYTTANAVVYTNSSSVGITSSALTFNGTTLTANTIGAFTLGGTIAGGGNQINNVIIGTTTPLAGSFTTLSATGVATFSAGTVSLPAITTTGDTNTGIYFPAADTIATSTGGSERLRINSTGNVGIGTNSPSQALQVAYGNNGYILSQQSNTLASTLRANLALVNGSTTFGASDRTYRFSNLGTSATASDLVFDYWNGTAFTERMRIDSAGLVGIGTSSQSSPLVVGTNQTQTVASAAQFNGNGTALSTGNAIVVISSTNVTPAADIGGSLAFAANTTTLSSYPMASISGRYETVGAGVYSGYLAFATTTSAGAPTERMRIDSSGNVLIGKTSPTSNGGDLQVSSGITFPATQVAASDANTLDDYEEGTWTATLTPLTSGTITLSANTCTYTKVGRKVTVTGEINTSAISSPLGRLRIGTLPFVSGSGKSFESVATIRVVGAVAIIAIDALLPNAGNYIDIYPAGTSTDTYASNIDASTGIVFSATYFV